MTIDVHHPIGNTGCHYTKGTCLCRSCKTRQATTHVWLLRPAGRGPGDHERVVCDACLALLAMEEM